MDKSSSDLRTQILTDIIMKNDPISVYELSKNAKWSYGKTERMVNNLLQKGIINSQSRIQEGRNVKLLSLHPFREEKPEDQHSINLSSSRSVVPEPLKNAFLQLYDIFKELNAIGLDPTPALLSYGKKQGIDPEAIIALLDNTKTILEKP
jgi:predicted transcriptional regulator